ncbi:MAG: hypothetical protein Q8K85_03485 [Hyphomicrobium sp.]|nr:hypothetical protein [Hyphomicrobium sp.]
MQKFAGVTPATATGADSGADSGSASEDPTSDTGSGPVQDRLDVVVAVHRYYQAFIEMNGRDVCSLLTTAGQEVMTKEGGEPTCEASAERLLANAGARNLERIAQTREDLFFDDVTVKDDDATAQLGENRRLRLVRENGRWLVRSPNVITTGA